MPPPTTHSWLRYTTALWPQRGGGGVPEVSTRLQRGRPGWVGRGCKAGSQEGVRRRPTKHTLQPGAMQQPPSPQASKHTDTHLNFQVSTSNMAREPLKSREPPIPPKNNICRAAGSKKSGINASSCPQPSTRVYT